MLHKLPWATYIQYRSRASCNSNPFMSWAAKWNTDLCWDNASVRQIVLQIKVCCRLLQTPHCTEVKLNLERGACSPRGREGGGGCSDFTSHAVTASSAQSLWVWTDAQGNRDKTTGKSSALYFWPVPFIFLTPGAYRGEERISHCGPLRERRWEHGTLACKNNHIKSWSSDGSTHWLWAVEMEIQYSGGRGNGVLSKGEGVKCTFKSHSIYKYPHRDSCMGQLSVCAMVWLRCL